MRNKQSQMPNAASGNTTLISSGTTVTGDISFSGNLDIEGKVIGSISAEPGASALLRVVAGGAGEGEIRVPSASISGSVKGNIYSAENLELTKGAVVAGDVFYTLIEMSMGRKIEGRLKHSPASAKVEPISSVTVTSSAEKA